METPALTELGLGRYRLTFERSGSGRLPSYCGSAWRGAFGHALKRAVCVTGLPECARCLLYHACPYAYIFETPPPPDADRMRRYRAAPHPFVLEPAERFDGTSAQMQDDSYILGLVLVGRANQFLPYVIYALIQAGVQGIGRERVAFRLTAIEQDEVPGEDLWRAIGDGQGALSPLPPRPLTITDKPKEAHLNLVTPLRLVRDERLVGPAEFRFSDLFGSLLRRVSMLSYFHGGRALEVDFRGLKAASQGVRIEKHLEWCDWSRHSTRQKARMQMGGLTGEIMVCLDGCEEASALWPFLRLGALVHAGKGATMGLGRYDLAAASLPSAA